MENESVLKIIKKAKQDKQIIAVALFGSSLRGKGRDIDICIFLDKKYSNLEMSKKRLEFLNGLSDEIDLQIFQQLPIYIRIRIIKEGKILFCKNLDHIYKIAIYTKQEFDFFKKAYYMYLNAIKNG